MRTSLQALSLILAVAVLAHAAEGARRTKVLEVFQAAIHARPGAHFNSRDLLSTGIVSERVPEAGRRLYVPVLGPHCGTGMIYGGLERERATTLARALFACYGYGLEGERKVGTGEDALVLDGFDPAAKVGWLLVGAPESASDATAASSAGAARARLTEQGLRVLVAPARRYRSMQADTVSPLLAFGLSVLDFLNDVTEGEDVDLGGLVTGRTLTAALPPLAAKDVPHTTSFQVSDGNAFFVAQGRGATSLAFGALSPSRSTGPGLLVLPYYWTPAPGPDGRYDFGTPPPRFVLEQGDFHVESRSGVFVLPAPFDGSKAFRVRVQYVPGQVYLGGPVTFRAP